MSDMATRLRDLYDYANSHRTFDLGLLLEAADEIERLKEQVADAEQWYEDNFGEAEKRVNEMVAGYSYALDSDLRDAIH